MLTATTIGGNHNLVVFAVAFVSVENLSNWTYFVRQLKATGLACDWKQILLLSDRDKGLSG